MDTDQIGLSWRASNGRRWHVAAFSTVPLKFGRIAEAKRYAEVRTASHREMPTGMSAWQAESLRYGLIRAGCGWRRLPIRRPRR